MIADVFRNALFASAEATDEKFSQMNQTFASVGMGIKNNALMAFQPILTRLNEIANSPGFQVFANNAINALVTVAGVVMWIFDLTASIASFTSDNWSLIAPIVYGVAAAMAIYSAALLVNNIIQGISNIQKGIAAIQSVAHGTATAKEAAATCGMTAAQLSLNASLYACPITWIIISIIALIALVYLVVAAVNKFAGTSVSATGIIFGAFAWLGSVVANIFMGLLDLVFGVVNLMVSPFIWFANFIGNFLKDPVSAVVYLFQSMADSVLGILEKIASALDFVFGSHMADTVAGWRSGLKEMADSVVKSRGFNPDDFNAINELDLSVEKTLGWERFDNTDAFNAGYTAGENFESAISNFDLASLFESNIPSADDYDDSYDPSNMARDVANISSNTSDMKSASEEDLKYLRDIAERETINKFTIAEINFDMFVEILYNQDKHISA